MKATQIILAIEFLGVSKEAQVQALTNTSCPKGGTSYTGSVQQQILPWKWSEQQWHSNLWTISKLLGDFGVPYIGSVGDVANAIWNFVDGAFVSDNTVHQIMSLVYSIVKKEIDEGILDYLNKNFDDLGNEITNYQTQEQSRCVHLFNALQIAEDNYNTMKEYTIDPPYQIFLTHLATAAHLHLSVYREIIYNGTDPTVCCDYNITTQTCVVDNSYVDQANNWYNLYYEAFLDWLPQWYEWRKSQISYGTGGCGVDCYKYHAGDKLTGMKCNQNGNYPKDKSTAKAHAKGTAEAMINDAVANMLGSMDLFSGLHRLIPGNETEPRIYPNATSPEPLNFYRTGIWVGPYRWNKDQLQGYNDGGIVKDKLGVLTQMYTSAGNSLDYAQMTYTYGKGHGVVKDPDNFGETWEMNGGYLKWMYLGEYTYNTYGSIQIGYMNHSDGNYAVSPLYGGHNKAGVNMTIADNFAMVSFGQEHKDGPSGTYPIGTVMTAWIPQSLTQEELSAGEVRRFLREQGGGNNNNKKSRQQHNTNSGKKKGGRLRG